MTDQQLAAWVDTTDADNLEPHWRWRFEEFIAYHTDRSIHGANAECFERAEFMALRSILASMHDSGAIKDEPEIKT